MVHVSTKFALSEEQASLCSKPPTWWGKNKLTNEFINMPTRVAGTVPFNMDLDLPDGEYEVRCGDTKATDSNGRKCTQSICFYVQGGQIHYCKWNEYPSMTGQTTLTGSTPAKPAGYNPYGATAPAQTAPAQPVSYDYIPGYRFCTKDQSFKKEDFNCFMDFESRDGVGEECCKACLFGKPIAFAPEP